MKKYRLLILLVALLLIAGIYFFSNNKGSLSLRNTSFAVEIVDEITGVRIIYDSATLHLDKKVDHWMVNNKYRATKWSINNFMMALNRLDVISPVSKVSKEQIASILKKDGVRVELYKNGRTLKKYYVSKPGMNNEKTYMMMYKSSEPFVVGIPSFQGLVSDLFATDENLWRDKTIFDYQPQNIKTILIEYPENQSKSFQVINFGDGTFALKNILADAYVEEYNVEKVVRFFTYFQRITFDEVVTNLTQHQVDSVIQSEPYIVISVEDIHNNKNKLSIYRKPPESQLDEFGERARFDYNKAYARFNNNSELIQIQYYKFDPLFKEIDYFR